MNTTRTAAALALAGLATSSTARLIIEDFDGADFNPELNFDFSSDFTDFDTSDHMDGVLWLYSDLADITVTTLGPGEWIESVEVTWTDFCGLGCTNLELLGDNNSFNIGNADVQGSETVFASMADLGEPITNFTISSFEGRIERIVVDVVPAPSALGFLSLAGLAVARRRR
ncbi:MAG: hypothetical protein JJ974_09145 [Phycisphaerales bacterium]|nr:hypothetical protein [Phycisphaerales bacterium]